MSDSGASHIETLEIEQQKLSRNSNGQNGLLSTPAVSAVIRERVGADVNNVFYSLLLVYLYFSLLCLECVLFPQR